MALLKKNENAVPEEAMVAPITSDEVRAIEEDNAERREQGASTERLELATDIISRQFGLDDGYMVNKFDDKGKVVKLTLENNNFIIAVTIKDSERHGMFVE